MPEVPEWCSYAPRANLDVQTHLLRGFLWAASETGGGIRERMLSFQARPQAISQGPTSRPPWVPDRKVEIGECSESKLVGAEAHAEINGVRLLLRRRALILLGIIRYSA